MEKKKKKVKYIQIFRHIIQLVMVLCFPGMFTTIFYALKSVYTALITLSFSWQILQIFLMLVGVLVTTLVFGRFFCGFMCSFGAMGDLLWFISSKTLRLKWRMPRLADRILKYLKYAILVFIFIVFWTLQYTFADVLVSPWTVFGNYVSIKGWSDPRTLVSIGGLLLLLIMIGSFFVERFFCRYLCPLGAVFSLVSRFRPYVLVKNRKKCGNCKACTHFCSMGIPLNEMDQVRSGECIQCFQCKEICPKGRMRISPSPFFAAGVSVLAMTAIVYIGTMSIFPVNNNVDSDPAVSVSEGKYEDGVYTGIGQGFRGQTEVAVTVENGKISQIDVTAYKDDREYFNRAKAGLVPEILKQQTTEVDAVAGATFSSNGIKEAVADAVKLKGTVEKETAKETEKQTEVQTEPQTQPQTEPQTEFMETSEPEAAVGYTDGIYTGYGTGYRGTTEVSVTVEGGRMTDIAVVSYMDDDRFFLRAKDDIIQRMIDLQTPEVDAVSGATYSSNSIKEAVANALSQ